VHRAPLVRALSKLGLASRKDARALIAAGRVILKGRVTTDGRAPVDLRHDTVIVDGRSGETPEPRLLAFHKPRGVLTTKRDPQGRRTVFDVLGERAEGLNPVGRLDLASTGLLLFTNDTALANRLTDPNQRVMRRYVVTVRGRVSEDVAARLMSGLEVSTESGGRERLLASSVAIRKASGRESHLIVELIEGKNREIRRLFSAIGHEVTRVHRVSFGPFELGTLQPGESAETPIPAEFRSRPSR
jgi:23S rRNA pseudouridine2605 synthase